MSEQYDKINHIIKVLEEDYGAETSKTQLIAQHILIFQQMEEPAFREAVQTWNAMTGGKTLQSFQAGFAKEQGLPQPTSGS